MAFFRQYPFGPDATEIRLARVLRQQAEIWRDDDKKSSAHDLDDFIPDYALEEEDQKEPWEGLLDTVKGLNQMFGGDDKTEQ